MGDLWLPGIQAQGHGRRASAGRLLARLGQKAQRLGYLLASEDGFDLRQNGVVPPAAHTLRRVLGGFGIRTVLDVGAYHGDFARLALAALGEVDVHCFEPLDTAALRLRAVVSTLPGRVVVHPIALSGSDRRVRMRRHAFAAASSVYEISSEHVAAFPEVGDVDAVEDVPARSLESWRRDNPLEEPILLKLDVQGAELDVLGGGAGLSGVEAIVVELSLVEMYHGAPRLADVVTWLHEHGFSLVELLGFLRDPRTQRLLQVDGIFTR